jgi:hypothetical protein
VTLKRLARHPYREMESKYNELYKKFSDIETKSKEKLAALKRDQKPKENGSITNGNHTNGVTNGNGKASGDEGGEEEEKESNEETKNQINDESSKKKVNDTNKTAVAASSSQ